MSAPVAELTRKQALALWGKLRQHFIDAASVMESALLAAANAAEASSEVAR